MKCDYEARTVEHKVDAVLEEQRLKVLSRGNTKDGERVSSWQQISSSEVASHNAAKIQQPRRQLLPCVHMMDGDNHSSMPSRTPIGT